MALAPQSQRKRYRPLWDSMIDFMIAKPGATNEEIGNHVNRKPISVSMIINSDLFKARYAQRRMEFNLRHDGAIMDKTVKIAHASLDAILGVVEKKKDSIPLATLQSISESALGRLGYGAKPPEGATVLVNNTQNNVTQIVAPVSKEDLLEAQMAYRQVQRMVETKQIVDVTPTSALPSPTVASEGMQPEAGSVKSEEDEEVAPSTLPA